jgi:hypothetical protein
LEEIPPQVQHFAVSRSQSGQIAFFGSLSVFFFPRNYLISSRMQKETPDIKVFSGW